MTASGEIGMANSAIDWVNALYETNDPGVLERVGGAFFGDPRAKVWKFADLFVDVRPAAYGAGVASTIRDFFDVVNGVNELNEAATPEGKYCLVK